MVRIRLTRAGAKKKPFYRILAIDQREKRNGRPLEYLGTYDPTQEPAKLNFETEKIDAWLAKGAQLSPSVSSLLKRARVEGAAASEAQ